MPKTRYTRMSVEECERLSLARGHSLRMMATVLRVSPLPVASSIPATLRKVDPRVPTRQNAGGVLGLASENLKVIGLKSIATKGLMRIQGVNDLNSNSVICQLARLSREGAPEIRTVC